MCKYVFLDQLVSVCLLFLYTSRSQRGIHSLKSSLWLFWLLSRLLSNHLPSTHKATVNLWRVWRKCKMLTFKFFSSGLCHYFFLKLHFRWVSADNLESFIETKGNQGNLQMTKAIARRFGWCQGVAIVKKMTDISQEIPSEKFEQDTICSWELCE